jgi:hypothetical protein
MSTQIREILYTDSQDMLVLSSTVAVRYYNCCTDGNTSPGNYGFWNLPVPLTTDTLHILMLLVESTNVMSRLHLCYEF